MDDGPIRIGILFDYPSESGRRHFEAGFPVGLEEVIGAGRVSRPVDGLEILR